MPDLRTHLTAMAADLPPTYWYLWLGTVVTRLGGFVIPFLTLYLTSQRGISVSEAGLIVSLFGAGSFISQVAGGELADRLGRRPVLLMSLFITPVFMLLLGFARNLAAIAVSTFVLGMFTDLYRPAVSAAIADLVPTANRAKAFGYLYWAINLGAALAPLAAGLIARFNYLLLFIGDAVTTFIYGLIVLRRVPETQPIEAAPGAHVSLSARLRQLGREPIVLALAGLSFLAAMVYVQSIVTLPLDMSRHGLSPADYGIAIAANAILIVLVTIQASRLVGKWPRFGALALAVLLIGAGFGFNSLASTLPLYLLGVMIWTLGEIINAAVAPTLIADLSPVELRGLYQGVFGAAWGLSFFIGPFLGSWAFDRFTPDGLWLGCAALGAVAALGFLGLSGPGQRRLAGSIRGSAPATGTE